MEGYRKISGTIHSPGIPGDQHELLIPKNIEKKMIKFCTYITDLRLPIPRPVVEIVEVVGIVDCAGTK